MSKVAVGEMGADEEARIPGPGNATGNQVLEMLQDN